MAKKETIDFSGVPEEVGRQSQYIPPGDYEAKITKWEKKWKNDDRSNVPYYSWSIQVTKGEHKGKTVRSTTSLKPDALFNLRNLIFAALGKNVAGKSVNFDPDKLIGKKVGITVEDNEVKKDDGNSKMYSNVADFMPLGQLNEDDDEEEETEEETEDEDELEDVDDDDL